MPETGCGEDPSQTIARLEKEKFMLQSELNLHLMVLKNSSEIINIMTNFYYQSYQEISSTGFQLTKLETIRSVLSEAHLCSLRKQIAQLKAIEQKIHQVLPSVFILEDFLHLLNYL